MHSLITVHIAQMQRHLLRVRVIKNLHVLLMSFIPNCLHSRDMTLRLSSTICTCIAEPMVYMLSLANESMSKWTGGFEVISILVQ